MVLGSSSRVGLCLLLFVLLWSVHGQEDVVGAGTTRATRTTTGETEPPVETTEVSTTNATTTIAPTKPASTRAPRECVNLDPLCIFWKIHGECQKNPDYMEFNCRKTCKKCESYPTAVDVQLPGNKSYPCSDDHDLCLFWSKRDQCNRNFYWMLKHCPFSCGYCSTRCRICLPPSEAPPGVEDLPKLFYAGHVLQRGGIPQIDFSHYQVYIPPEAFGLHGDPDIQYHYVPRGRRPKRGKPRTYQQLPQQPREPHQQQHGHHHGGGSAWTVLPNFRPCGPIYQPEHCPTVAPLPCCIPVHLADQLGLLPIGAFVTPASPVTPIGLSPILSIGSGAVIIAENAKAPTPPAPTKATISATTLAPAPAAAAESRELVDRARKVIRLRKLPQDRA